MKRHNGHARVLPRRGDLVIGQTREDQFVEQQAGSAPEFAHRWMLLAAAFVVMMIVGIYQYSWFLFSYRIHNDLGWDLATIGLVYTAFHYTSTLVMPFSGYVADSRGPRVVATTAAVLTSAGLLLCGWFLSEWAVLAAYGLGGVGTGVLYGLSTATAVKWFPDRRGFATGCAVFGFGAGTALFNPVIELLLNHRGVAVTFLYLGLFMLVLLLPLAQVYRYPSANLRLPSVPARMHKEIEFAPSQMLRTYQWYVMYFSFSMTVSIVLVLGAQMKTLASEFQLPAGYFSALLVLFPLANGLSRIVAGFVSDRLGRIRAMQLFYTLLGFSILGLVWLGHVPGLFFLFVVLAALFGGAPFVLYPATIGDFYGSRYSTTNYGITYTAKAWAGVISGWFSGYVIARFGTLGVLLLGIALSSLVAALLAHPRLLTQPKLREAS